MLTGGMCSRLVRRKELKDDGSKDFKWIDCTVWVDSPDNSLSNLIQTRDVTVTVRVRTRRAAS